MVEIQRLASGVVVRTLAGSSLDAVLAEVWQRHRALGDNERGALRDLAYGTLRFLGRLQAYVDELTDRPPRDARLRALLLVALYQLEHTRAAQHAIVDHAVRCATRMGLSSAKGLVNAVLRRFLRTRTQVHARALRLETARFSHPQWWIDHLREQYPGCFEAILDAATIRPPLALRVNRRRTTPADYLALLAVRDMSAQACPGGAIILDTPVPAARIPGLEDGLVSVQDAAAQLAAPLLDLADGQRVLDACAAPGGKSTHILELADCRLTSLDSDEVRLERLHANLTRLGLQADVVGGDACEPAAWWDGQPFDRILADVPCTASGVTRRHPDVKWLRRRSDIGQFVLLQRRMLEALWQLLRRDGKLLYATCSVFQEENHRQVESFLQRHPDAQRLTIAAADDNPECPAGQLLPDRQHDGFFYALLRKT